MMRIGQSGRDHGSVGGLFAAQTAALGHQPFLTFYDDAGSERTELSYATFFNWAAKSANLLSEELRLEPGGTVAITVNAHWTGAVLTVAAWMVGAAVAFDDAGEADVLVVPESEAANHAHHAGLLVIGAGMGGRLTHDAPGLAFGDEVLAFGDDYHDPDVTPATPALSGPPATTNGDLLADAVGQLGSGDRLLVVQPLATSSVAALLVAPALAGAAVVWCPTAGGLDLSERSAAERVTRVLGADGAIAPPA